MHIIMTIPKYTTTKQINNKFNYNYETGLD